VSEWESNLRGQQRLRTRVCQLSATSTALASLLFLWCFASLPVQAAACDSCCFNFHVRLLFAFLGYHLIGLSNQILQFIFTEHIQSLQQNPFVAAHIRRWTNPFQFAQLGKIFGRALEAQALRNRAQAQSDKNLCGHFEAKSLAPLQVFPCLRKGETIVSNRINVHTD